MFLAAGSGMALNKMQPPLALLNIQSIVHSFVCLRTKQELPFISRNYVFDSEEKSKKCSIFGSVKKKKSSYLLNG